MNSGDHRSLLRELLTSVAIGGGVTIALVLLWHAFASSSSGALGSLGFFQSVWLVLQHALGSMVAVCLACAAAALGAVFSVRRFQRALSAYLTQLKRLPDLIGRGALSNPTVELNYAEMEHISGAVADIQRGYNDREAQHERSRLKLKDELQQRTQEASASDARAEKLANTDPLTQLPNRAMLTLQLMQVLADAMAQRAYACVMVIDIDHFKRLNESLGHALGDRVLLHVASVLRAHLREADIVARYGGDEFVVVLRNLPPESARSLVERYLGNVYTSLRSPIELGERTTLITLSIGAAAYPTDASDGAALLRAADAAMFVAKQKGRNRADWYERERDRDTSNASALEQALRDAIATRQLSVVYQPQVRTDDGVPVGIEALVRWNHPKRGLIMPGQFIPVAEESGLIVPLGQRVLEQVLSHAKRWNARDLNMRISVNLSVRQLEQQGWVEALHTLIDSNDLPASLMDLEITESVISDDPVAMEKTLRKLSERGFTLSLDDFGTGYSSLNYLARFPFNHVKIDRQFINDMDNEASRNVVQSIIALGHTLKMRTIAEGVETPQQFRMLRDMGCDEVQGFFVAEPMSADALPIWWQQRMESSVFLAQNAQPRGASKVVSISDGKSTSAMQ